MARGNQRELARAKNQKKQAAMNKGKKDDGTTFKSRQERDAEIMRQKQKKKEEKEEAERQAKMKENSKK